MLTGLGCSYRNRGAKSWVDSSLSNSGAGNLSLPEGSGVLICASADARLRRTSPAGRESGTWVHKERGTVTSKNVQNAKPVIGGRGRPVGGSPELARELCTCGHRAGNHAALKYSCQAPGDHKGYCPCMRFISAKEWRGNKSRSA